MAKDLEVAILFADVVGSTQLYDKFGDTKASETVAACLNVMIESARQSTRPLLDVTHRRSWPSNKLAKARVPWARRKTAATWSFSGVATQSIRIRGTASAIPSIQLECSCPAGERIVT